MQGKEILGCEERFSFTAQGNGQIWVEDAQVVFPTDLQGVQHNFITSDPFPDIRSLGAAFDLQEPEDRILRVKEIHSSLCFWHGSNGDAELMLRSACSVDRRLIPHELRGKRLRGGHRAIRRAIGHNREPKQRHESRNADEGRKGTHNQEKGKEIRNEESIRQAQRLSNPTKHVISK